MRAIPRPSKAEINRVSEEVWKINMECQHDQTAMLIIAAAREFNLGKKRLKRLLNRIDEVNAEYAEYDKDDVFRDKVSEELGYLGFTMEDIYVDEMSFGEFKRQHDRSKKPKLSVKEEFELKKNREAFQKLLRSGE